MNRQEKSDLLGRTIRANSATRQGFAVTDCPQAAKTKAAHQRCRIMVIAGTLFKARVHFQLIRYFSTPEGAKEFMHANRHHEAVKLSGPAVSIERKPIYIKQIAKLPTAPKKDAVIIWPEHIKPVCRMMPPPRFTTITHTFIHGGMVAM